MKDIENSKKESPMLGLTGMGGGVASLMFAGVSGPTDFTIWVAGRNYIGNLGQNSNVEYSSPVQVGTTTDWISFKAGNMDRCLGIRGASGSAEDTNGTLWAWGMQDSWGELGQNNRTKYSSPTQIGTGTDWTHVASNSQSLATKTNGTLWMWGHNANGTLGDNTNVPRSSPIQVGTNTTWDGTRMAAAGQSVMAIKTDGSLWTWGQFGYGIDGRNSFAWPYWKRSSPAQLGTDTTWDQVCKLGQYTAAAIKNDNTLWVWGAGGDGKLGLNAPGTYSSPVQLSGTNWAKVQSIGGSYAFGATKTDGTMWFWGRPVVGSFGNNEGGYPSLYFSSPTQLPGSWHPTNWNGSANAECAVQAMKADGTLWAWGENSYGSLCQNDVIHRSSPVQIPGTWTWWDKGSFGGIFVGKKGLE